MNVRPLETSSTGSSDSDHTLSRSVPRTRWQAIAGAREGPKVNIISAPSYTNEVCQLNHTAHIKERKRIISYTLSHMH